MLLSGIIIIFIRYNVSKKDIKSPEPPENTDATFSLKNFHHIATQNGIKKWKLEASSASVYAKQDLASLKDISVTFYMIDSNNQNITLTADDGLLNTKTNNISVNGNIIVKTEEYILKTENLNYVHHSHIINVNEPFEIIGSSVMLKADSMTYDINAELIKCNGNVEGSFLENIK